MAWKEKVEENIEEMTNRQLRKTLVFYGVPETNEEKDWKATDSLLSKKLSDVLEVDISTAENMIDRCHRGGKKVQGKPRRIFAAMKNWKDCETIIKSFRQKRAGIVDHKFGPLTTRRRQLALKKRYELKNSGQSVSGFLAYPARLMGRKDANSGYELIEDFSKTRIVFS